MNNEQIIWQYLKNKNFTDAGAAGMMGNLFAESALNPTNLQNSYENKLDYTDSTYTKAVDNGSYKNFVNDKAGYGIAQWTYWSRKEGLLNFAISQNKSIGDLNMQLDYLMQELNTGYKSLLKILTSTNSVREASNGVLLQFERPANQGTEVQTKRASYSLNYFNKFATPNSTLKTKMKYNDNNIPLVCMQTNSTCYKQTTTMKPIGILWHSTGANNPYLSRYVQPSDNDANYSTLIKTLGKNKYGNDWNHIYRTAGLNCWIGKLANGEVATVQTMPWNYRPWGCGAGKYGSCNDGWIQFEICEDNLNDENYFNKVYQEACEITAYLCKMYNINPKGSVTRNGIKVPTILCHQDSARLGFGGNHSDVYHWFNRYGKTMQDVRNDVVKLLEIIPDVPVVNEPIIEEEEEMTQEQFNTMMNNWIAEQADKDANTWSEDARTWAEKNGLVNGDEKGRKMYKKILTREELVTVLYRALHRNILD